MSAPMSRLDELKAHLAAPSDCRSAADADLRWAVEEIGYLRFYLSVLGDFAFAVEGLRWALENPAPGRVERRRRVYEDALQELMATPNWRPGECQSGCRRYATHELVIEGISRTAREPRCEECGRRDVACCKELTADDVPAVIARLEPLARSTANAREGGQ